MSLYDFPTPSTDVGCLVACEQNTQLVSLAESRYAEFKRAMLPDYPNVAVGATGALLQQSFSRDVVQSIFLVAGSGRQWSLQTLRSVWLDRGWLGVLDYLASFEGGILGSASKILRRAVDACASIQSKLPTLYLRQRPAVDAIHEYSGTLDWRNACVRSVAWHPYGNKLAICLPNDYIRVYPIGSSTDQGQQGSQSSFSVGRPPAAAAETSRAGYIWLLRHAAQRNVAAMAWRPNAANILAVACDGCVIVWHLDAQQLVLKPSPGCAEQIDSYAKPVTYLAWSPCGKYLAYGGALSRFFTIYDVFTDSKKVLGDWFSAPISQLSWSPDGAKLCVCYVNSSLRVYETESWLSESWSGLAGRCRAVSWSPDGSVLLFATEFAPTLFALSFMRRFSSHAVAGRKADILIGGAMNALPVFDFSVRVVADAEITPLGDKRLGGRVQSIAWDENCERLAVSFSQNPEHVALFRTNLRPVLDLQPLGWISSPDDAAATLLSFQPNHSQSPGSVLTIVWSNGRIQFVPLLYASQSQAGKLQQQESLLLEKRSLTKQLSKGRLWTGDLQRTASNQDTVPLLYSL